ncbi:ceramide synthase 1-like isoform X1 [Tachypleus tridentatus]|uniref:ceramide synthase 1-like isoform X1 n=2 Tax=Tachypleus tridentatus TaxID=6853 RepID=UPI003FD2AAE2
MALGETVVEWERVPSYFEFIVGIFRYVVESFNQLNDPDYDFPRGTWRDMKNYWHFNTSCILTILLMAVAWTVVRHFSTEWIFKPVGKLFALSPHNQMKMPESAWKFVYSSCVWTSTVYIVCLSGRYQFFHRPSTVWDNWHIDEPVPIDIYILYIVQCSFYLHSVYATLFLDTWRKDSIVLLIHHVITLVLVSSSLALRYQNIGILVLLLHDICDVQLEFTKLNVYFKIQGGRLQKHHEHVANLSFCIFALTWFVSRLYWFPLKVLYVSSQNLVDRKLSIPFATFLNLLLWVLLAMNIYWFMLILGFLFKVATGQMQEVDDTREYDVLEKIEKRTHYSSLQNGDISHNVQHDPHFISARSRKTLQVKTVLSNGRTAKDGH